MHIEVDRDICVGAGNCVMTVEEVFDQDEEGLVDLRQSDPPAELADQVERAVQMCPAGAISTR